MIKKHTHIGSYGIVTNGNEIILIKKGRGGHKGKLDLPGGGIEHTESPDEALKREIMEEAGINITNFKLITTLSDNFTWEMEPDLYEDLHHLGIIYLVEADDTKLNTEGDDQDSRGANWYDINTISTENLTPFAKYAINYLKTHK